MVVSKGVGAHPKPTRPQGHGQNGTRGPLLHHQPETRCQTTEGIHAPALGHRKQTALHWALDVGFGEDHDRKRAGHAAQNFSVLNRIALNLLQQDKTSKRGVHGKKLKAGWNNDSLLHLLKM